MAGFVMVAVIGLPPALKLHALPVLYDTALSTNPVATRVATAASLAVVGDAIVQQQQGDSYNVNRMAGLAAVEATYRGMMQQPMLNFLAANFDGSLLQPLLPLLPLTLCAAFERTLINMFVFATLVYYPLFFAITGHLQGLTFKQSFERAKRRYAGLLGVSTAFWLPVQLLQFLCVPAKYQVPFISLAGCVWNIILSAFGEAERVRPHAFGEPPKPKRRAGGLGRVMPVRRRVQREQLATAAGAA